MSVADITLLLNNYGQDMDQDDDDYSRYYESSMLDQTNPDDLLSPLEKLQKYCTSINVFTRQMVARSIIETVQSIQSAQECLSLLEVITKLSNDLEPSVRNELMEHLPPCSLMIMNMRLVPNAIPDFILPVMVKYLTDSNNSVRKLTQNALLQLIDQEMITRVEVERQICPVLLQLTEPDSGDDFRTEAVGLMTSITPLIGNENAQHSFLRRFGDLCADPLFHVRKVCASNFGDMCSVLTQETTEQQLLPLFARLCEDGVWGVRKACAETFIAVSGSCSRQVRFDRLSPLFVGLLCDKSRWVQMAAYLALGQFISTFAEPERSGFDIDEKGMLVRCQKLNLTTATATSDRDSPLPPLEDPSLESDRLITSSPNKGTATETINGTNTTKDASSSSPENDFNNFEYWRTPIPNVSVIDLPDLLDQEPTSDGKSSTHTTPTKGANNHHKQDNGDDKEGATLDTSLDDDSNKDLESQRSDAVSPRPSVRVGDHHHHDDFMHMDPGTHGFHSDSDEEDSSSNLSLQQSTSNYASSIVDDESLHNQTVVPPALLEHYISMTEENKAKTIDGELPRHCAYTMPGVVLALGAEHWPLLKDTYELLSTDMQWKVRRSLAFSIHDLALILGEEICVRDLVPVFNSFLKDLDEVRVGVLNHLYDFISLLPDEWQKEYLQLFNEFRVTDNMRNWRFRGDLAQQLMNLSTLYTETELADYICPVALELAADKVAEVRQNAFHLICILIRRVSEQEKDKEILRKFVANIVSLGAPSQHWVQRKACSQIYQHILEGSWYDSARFAENFLTNLLTLCEDTVPNIRFIAAQALISFMKSEHYQSLPEDDETRKVVDNTLETLQLDGDRDVRFYSGGKVKERTFSVSDDDEDEDEDGRSEDGDRSMMGEAQYMQKITRGIHEYTISSSDTQEHGDDDDDEDPDLVEEVYMEEHGLVVSEDIDPRQQASSGGVLVDGGGDAAAVEEYYADEDPAASDPSDVFVVSSSSSKGEGGETTQYLIEEIVEEVIETIKPPPPPQQQQQPSSSQQQQPVVGEEAPVAATNPDMKPESDSSSSETDESSTSIGSS